MNHDKNIPFQAVEFTDGFWKRRQDINAKVTADAIKKRFMETGRFDAFKFNWREGQPNKPFFYWKGDIEKCIEGTSYILKKEKRPDWVKLIDEVTFQIRKAQDVSGGYYDVYYTTLDPEKRWTERDGHELYTAGSMIEAAIAYYESTGNDGLLQCAKLFADEIERVFIKDHEAFFITCGHPEIELSLVKLYRCTGEKRYLELSKFFVEERGRHEEDLKMFTNSWHTPGYSQSHLPVREQEDAVGHAVRATYLYSAMADLAYEYNDESLLDACRTLFNSIVNKRMYITGGIGSSARDEGFTMDYDLPNLYAYAETCAGIGLMFFAQRMLKMEPDAIYADAAERVMYNAFLSSISLDGLSFFYENPLEIDPRLTKRELSFAKENSRMPATQRVEVFTCSCCPPNILRYIASLGNNLYTVGENTIYIHHYASGKTEYNGMIIEQETDYPLSGTVRIRVKNKKLDNMAIRLPWWCEGKWVVSSSSEKTVKYEIKNGYAYFACPDEGNELNLQFTMRPLFIEADPRVQENAGRIAVQRGPTIYCLESIDNGADLRDIHIDISAPVEEEYDAKLGTYVLHVKGWRRDKDSFNSLYRSFSETRITQTLRFIPYYAFANRDESEMIVWVGR
jgi:DUF1680 family protein